jgi:hypothetical protein
MNNFNEEMCEYTLTPVTENFGGCPDGMNNTTQCPTGCREWV